MMKKTILLIVTILLLAACGDRKVEEKSASTVSTENVKNSSESKAEQEVNVPTEEMSLDQAKLISGHVNSNFYQVWINAEELYLSFTEPEFSPQAYADKLLARYSKYATEGFLNAEFVMRLKDSCHSCDMLPPLPLGMYSAEKLELEDVTASSFTLKGYFPLDAFIPEQNVKQMYVLEDGIWKIDGEEIDVIQPGDGYTYREYEMVTGSAELEAIVSRATEVMSEYEAMDQLDLVAAEYTNMLFDKVTELKGLTADLEQLIVPFDTYYETNKQFWTELYDETILATEIFHQGGSGQGRFMLETELKLLQYRINDLYAMYNDYL